MSVGAVEHGELCVRDGGGHGARLRNGVEDVGGRAHHKCFVLDSVEDRFSRSTAATKIVGIHRAKQCEIGMRVEPLDEFFPLISQIRLSGEGTVIEFTSETALEAHRAAVGAHSDHAGRCKPS